MVHHGIPGFLGVSGRASVRLRGPKKVVWTAGGSVDEGWEFDGRTFLHPRRRLQLQEVRLIARTVQGQQPQESPPRQRCCDRPIPPTNNEPCPGPPPGLQSPPLHHQSPRPRYFKCLYTPTTKRYKTAVSTESKPRMKLVAGLTVVPASPIKKSDGADLRHP